MENQDSVVTMAEDSILQGDCLELMKQISMVRSTRF